MRRLLRASCSRSCSRTRTGLVARSRSSSTRPVTGPCRSWPDRVRRPPPRRSSTSGTWATTGSPAPGRWRPASRAHSGPGCGCCATTGRGMSPPCSSTRSGMRATDFPRRPAWSRRSMRWRRSSTAIGRRRRRSTFDRGSWPATSSVTRSWPRRINASRLRRDRAAAGARRGSMPPRTPGIEASSPMPSTASSASRSPMPMAAS